MQAPENTSGIFAFIVKTSVVLFIFGFFPVLIVLVVENYNQKAEGIIQKRVALGDEQFTVPEEVNVLTQEDATALQKINEFVLGEWNNPIDPEYRLRFEQDNTFNEFRNSSKVGFGLWRVTVYHHDLVAGDLVTDTASSTDHGLKDASSTDPVDIQELAFTPGLGVSYYLVRTQFESGKKSNPIRYKILHMTDLNMSLLLEGGSTLNLERSL